MRHLTRTCALAVLAITIVSPFPASAQKNRGKELRSLNSDVYQIAIQKNGQVDVFLAGEQPVVFDAFPMVWFADEDEPKRMKTNGLWTERYRVEDRLGDGNGMAQRFKALEWTLRAYPARPFFAVQMAYTNTGKKPVTIRALLPWCIGDPGKGALILGEDGDTSAILTDFTRGAQRLSTSEANGEDAIAVFNPRTGRSVIAGFITQSAATNRFELGAPKPDEDAAFYHFRAMSEFDPPITLQPGESLPSEVLYLAVGELDPVVGVQRYARGAVVANTTGPRPAPFRAWDLRGAKELPAAVSSASLDAVPIALLDATQLGAPLTDAVAARGLRAAVWRDPFAVAGFTLGNAASLETVATEAARIASTGTHTVAGIDLDRLLDAPYAGNRTRVSAIGDAVRAVREGLGDGGLLYATSPSLLATVLTDGVLAPHADPAIALAVSSIAPGTLLMEVEAGVAQSHQLQTLAALTDASVLFDPSVPADGSPPERAAAAADLFFAESPRVMYLRRENELGAAHVIAVFNWRDDVAESTELSIARLVGQPGVYFTVYDYWSRRYLGTAIDRLNVAVAPQDVAVLVLRPHTENPMPLVLGADLGQSTPQITSYTWDAQSAQLRMATSGAAYSLPVLVSERYEFVGIEPISGAAAATVSSDNIRVLDLQVAPAESGAAEFVLRFERK